jgi:citrate lyase subunit beta / citryl-CoA lyase
VRSLLFVPGDSKEKLEKAFRSGADALILDLEDSVSADGKEAARRTSLSFLQERRNESARPLLYVRINALSSPFGDGDLDVVMTGAPDGIMLPKATGGADIALLDARLAVREALHGIADGDTRIIPIATESAAAIFGLGTYAGASSRLAGLAWGAEDLATDTGAQSTRAGADWTEPNRLARNLTLFGATAADVPAIDTVYTDFRDIEGLRTESVVAAEDGFAGKLAIHPDQVEVINIAFTPSAESIERAEQIVAAFAAADGAGVIALDGKMLDRPHLKAAERLLARASANGSGLTTSPSTPS